MSNIESVFPRDFPKAFANSIWRTDLLDKIEKVSTGSVLIYSIAGYGKSTLLNQLVSRAQCAAVCILGPGDNTLSYFLNRLSSAIRHVVPKFEVNAAEDIFAVLLRICQIASKNRMMLVFDNCQAINNEAVCEALQFIMSAAENNFKVILGSRSIPAFAVKLILENRCQLLGRDDLALSEQEVAKLVKMYLGTDNEPLAKNLYSLTRGWVAGVVLCLRGRSENFSTKQDTAWESIIGHKFIKQYIEYEILSEIPSAIADFAKHVSLFDHLNVDFCDIVLNSNNSHECLEYLHENEIFIRRCPQETNCFVWIDIFKKALSDLLTTPEKTLLAEKTIEYYLRRKMHLQAVDMSLKLGQPSLISRTLSLCGATLLEEEKFDLLGRCARVLEKSNRQLDPTVYGILAQYYYVAGDYAKMEYNLNMADSMYGKENIYGIQRRLYRGLLNYEKDPTKYRKSVNNALFYLEEYNLKLPYLLPREQKILEEIKKLNLSDQGFSNRKPLLVKQFGPFKVIAVQDGREIPWRTKKGGELFAYLISLEGEAVDRSQLFDIIWKEELPNNSVAMLHNMIYNIRKELSAYKLEKIIQYKNKKYSIDMSLLESDMDGVSLVCAAISRKDMETLLEPYFPNIGVFTLRI